MTVGGVSADRTGQGHLGETDEFLAGAFQVGGGDAQPEGCVEAVAEAFGEQIRVVEERARGLQRERSAGDTSVGPTVTSANRLSVVRSSSARAYSAPRDRHCHRSPASHRVGGHRSPEASPTPGPRARHPRPSLRRSADRAAQRQLEPGRLRGTRGPILPAWQALQRTPGDPAEVVGHLCHVSRERVLTFQDVSFEPKAYRPDGPRPWFGGADMHETMVRRSSVMVTLSTSWASEARDMPDAEDHDGRRR
jgi:hypothetical protein